MKRRGFIEVRGGKIWYKVVGEKEASPIVVLHGGPGYPHDYLKPLEDLSIDRKIIFYDQLGCGNSERPTDNSLWTLERFVDELKEIIKKLNLNKYHLLGHSWGAALALSFALTKPKGLLSLILTDPYISTPIWEKDAKKLLQELPEDMQKALAKRDIKSKEYKRAAKEFYKRYHKRLKKTPNAFARANKKKNNNIYNYMWGPEEFIASGTLKNLDLSTRLSEIKLPVLLLSGEFDETTPESTIYFQSLFPNAQSKIFEDSAHYPFWNKRKEFIKTLQTFLKSID